MVQYYLANKLTASAIHITSSCVISNNIVYKNGEVLFAGNDPDLSAFLHDLYQHLGFSYARYYKMDNLSKLGWLASEVLLKDSFKKENYHSEEVGIVMANANSSLDSDLKYLTSITDIPSPSLFVYTLPNIVIGEICIRNKFKGETAFFISEKFDAEFMHQYVQNLFDTHIFKACICGWVEVVGNNYKAGLFLIEQGEGLTDFTMDNMNQLFDKEINI